MNSEIILTVDPQGIEVHLSADLFTDDGLIYPVDKLSAMLQTAVEAPSCMILMQDGDRYYFRSLEWNFTVLVRADCLQGKWEAVEWKKNPEPAYIQELLKGGTFIAGSNLG